MAKRHRILVVDDEKTMRDFLTASMTGKYEVVSASGGRAAAAILKRESFDLVLSDVRMPGGDGLELLHFIQEEQEEPPLVIMMTAFGTIQEAVNATKQGALDYLTKPFGMDQLEHVLVRAFELRKLRVENKHLRKTL